MPEKKWFEISGYVNCDSVLPYKQPMKRKRRNCSWTLAWISAEYIDWINDFSVDSITRSEPESGARALPV